MQDSLTIVLPILNNQEFTLRFLKYYNHFSFNYRLIIADGSKKKIGKRINLEIKKNKKITYSNLYKRYKSKDIFKRCSYILSFIKTPFVKVMANDDFFIDHTVKKCINFLKNNKEYNIAGGYLIDFNLKNNFSGKLFSLNPIYKLKSNSSKSSVQRINHYTNNGLHSTTHFVYSTKLFKNSIRLAAKKFNNDLEFREMYFELMNFVKSKMKMFNQPISLHQIHNKNEGGKREGILELLRKKDFFKNLKILNSQLNKSIKSKQKIDFPKIYFEKIVSPETKRYKHKAYYGIKDIMKLTNQLFEIKLRNNYEDNYNNFLKKIENKNIREEIIKIQNFLTTVKEI